MILIVGTRSSPEVVGSVVISGTLVVLFDASSTMGPLELEASQILLLVYDSNADLGLWILTIDFVAVSTFIPRESSSSCIFFTVATGDDSVVSVSLLVSISQFFRSHDGNDLETSRNSCTISAMCFSFTASNNHTYSWSTETIDCA